MFVATFAKQIRGNILHLVTGSPERVWLRQPLPRVHHFCEAKLMLVGRRRLELPTSPLSGARSNQLSYRPPYQHAYDLMRTIDCKATDRAPVINKWEEKRRRRPTAM